MDFVKQFAVLFWPLTTPSPFIVKAMVCVNKARQRSWDGERNPSTGYRVVNETSDKFSFPFCLLRKDKRKRIMLLQLVKAQITTQSSWEEKKQ